MTLPIRAALPANGSRQALPRFRKARPVSSTGSRERPLFAHSWAHALRLPHCRRLHRSSSRRESARCNSGCAWFVGRADAGDHARVQLLGNRLRLPSRTERQHSARAHFHSRNGAAVRGASDGGLCIRPRVDGRDSAKWRRNANRARRRCWAGTCSDSGERGKANLRATYFSETARDKRSTATAGDAVRDLVTRAKPHRSRRYARARGGVLRCSLSVHSTQETRNALVG